MGDHADSQYTQLDLPKECDYIVSKALAGENAIVMLGCLIFLANASGDAFALDVEDKHGCPLCLGREKLPYPVFDAGSHWDFHWPWRYFLARGSIYFETKDDNDTNALPSMKAGAIEREVARYNRKAGTNYHL